MTNHIIVRKQNHIIDVFHGEEGFEEHNWTRFLLKNKFLKYIKGAQMSPQDFNQVKKELSL